MTFYIIPSPIGNLDDITIRAKKILKDIDFLVVENKKVTSKLLSALDIKKKKIITYNDTSSAKDRTKIIELIKKGLTGGLVSDSGTPLISDPGFKLISEIIKNDFRLISLPGPTSVITALAGSGLSTDNFQFLGFFPRKKIEQSKILKKIKMYEGTSIFFESPKRLLATLEVMQANLNNQTKICVAKELTKIHESYIRGTFSEVLSFFSKNQEKIKGEFILLIDVVLDSIDINTADEIFEILKNDLSIKMISKLASGITGLSKNDLYKRFLSLSEKELIVYATELVELSLNFKRKVRTSKSRVPVNNWGT